MRFLLIVLLMLVTAGLMSCSASTPTEPVADNQVLNQSDSQRESNRWVWGNWMMHIPEDHSSIEVIPVRSADKHFNVKMLLEQEPCDNCIWVSKFKNNGDGTISIDITLRHPYTANAYFTGFDVRGIMYSNTSYTIWPETGLITSYFHIPALETGDPQLLNPDGYTNAFSPFMNNQHLYPPICLYQPEGDLGGTYDEDDMQFEQDKEFWPFISYYSSDVRRHFASNAIVARTYHIALPPGEWEFGYSVDACWAPPTTVPVADIETDFPPQANTLNEYRVDTEISGPLVGENPSTLTIRLYHHLPEVLPYYTHTDVDLYTVCVEDTQFKVYPEGPTIVNNEYVEYTYELSNSRGRPPGHYPILAYCLLGYDDYLDSIGGANWALNGIYCQVLWVTVAE
jgi:hypothetical protein